MRCLVWLVALVFCLLVWVAAILVFSNVLIAIGWLS